MLKLRLWVTVICIASIAFITSCGAAEKTSTDEWSTYRGKNGVEFSYPSSWIQLDTKKLGSIGIGEVEAMFRNELTSTNLSLIVEKSETAAPSAEEYANNFLKQTEASQTTMGVKNFKSDGYSPRKGPDSNAGVVLTFEYELLPNDKQFNEMKLFVSQKQNMYILTVGGPRNLPTIHGQREIWATEKPTYDKIIDSFTIK
ncbi:MAG: hypothetical protein K0Q59_2834 [Paenibacillus sp.]|nr:hypothetical protein [Paenibacillus sp.]